MVEPRSIGDSYLGKALGNATIIDRRPELSEQDQRRVGQAIESDDIEKLRNAFENIDKRTLSRALGYCIRKEAEKCFEYIISNYPYSGSDLKGIKSSNRLKQIARECGTLKGWLNQ